jgi:hypothetical protein
MGVSKNVRKLTFKNNKNAQKYVGVYKIIDKVLTESYSKSQFKTFGRINLIEGSPLV